MNSTKEAQRKLLIVLNYWNGDRDMMKSLAELICDLESKRNENADILFFRRWDAEQMPHALIHRLEEKFESVKQLACRRRNAGGYPYGPNEMFYDLLESMYGRDWQMKYYAFLNMEADCCPLSPDWIEQMIAAYTEAYNERKSAAGHFSYDGSSRPHLNGAGIYSTDFWQKAGGMNIIGGPANIAYDVYHAQRIVPISKDVSQILLDFNRKTINEEDLFSLKKNGNPVYYLHGVKDLSAITAVRNKFVQPNGVVNHPTKIRTVCTYFDQSQETNVTEQKQLIELWKMAWKSAGYNPVVLEEWDASKHPEYANLKAKTRDIKQPAKRAAMARLYRWLAFTHVGGGFYVEYDILPNASFTNEIIPEPDGVNFLEEGELSATSADRRGLNFLVEAIVENRYNTLYIPSDKDILKNAPESFWCRETNIVKPWNATGWAQAPLVHFSAKACKSVGATTSKVAVIEQFLKSIKRQG